MKINKISLAEHLRAFADREIIEARCFDPSDRTLMNSDGKFQDCVGVIAGGDIEMLFVCRKKLVQAFLAGEEIAERLAPHLAKSALETLRNAARGN